MRYIFALVLVFVIGCNRHEKKQEAPKEKNILQDYVETPLERSHGIAQKQEERDEELKKQLDEAGE